MQYRKSSVSHDRDALIKQFGLVFNNGLRREVVVSLSKDYSLWLIYQIREALPKKKLNYFGNVLKWRIALWKRFPYPFQPIPYKDKKLFRNCRSYARRYFVAVHRIVHPMHGDILWSIFGRYLVIFCGRYLLKPQWPPCIWEMVAHGSMGEGSSSTDGEGPHFTQKWVPIFTKFVHVDVNLVWRIFKKSEILLLKF